MASARTPLPERPRRYRFSLTPLADAMFQLLIFFMLSTSLTPYSLITLKSADPGAGEAAGDTGPGSDPSRPAASGGDDLTRWNVGRGIVTAGGQDFPVEQLGDLAEALAETGDTEVVLVIAGDARVQDIAYVLEALKGADVDGVQIREGAS